MIKIGAGTLAGRSIEQPKTTKTRPMTQKSRASIFNRLGDIEGLSVLDAYAGSGAIGIEALSLGAKHATFIEQARSVAKVIQDNLEKLNLTPKSAVLTQSVSEAAKSLQDQSFDIIVADPPYDQLQEEGLNLVFSRVAKNGICIVSHSSRRPVPNLDSVELIDSRTYGDTTISYYRGKIG